MTQNSHRVQSYVYIYINATEQDVYKVSGFAGGKRLYREKWWAGLQMAWHFLRSFKNRDKRKKLISMLDFSDFGLKMCAPCFIEHVQRAALQAVPFGVQGPFLFCFLFTTLFWCAWENNECLFITLFDSVFFSVNFTLPNMCRNWPMKKKSYTDLLVFYLLVFFFTYVLPYKPTDMGHAHQSKETEQTFFFFYFRSHNSRTRSSNWSFRGSLSLSPLFSLSYLHFYHFYCCCYDYIALLGGLTLS